MTPDAAPRARAALFAFVALAAAHLALCAYFAPLSLLSAATPPSNDAFALGVYRVARARLSAPGALFTYDPQMLAGEIAGLAEPLGSRAIAFAVLGLGKLRVAPVPAFNGVLIAFHAAFPFLGYAAARAFGFRHGAAVLTFALWSFGWFFDSLTHYTWYSGRIEWTLASAIGLVAAGIAWRLSTGGQVLGRVAALVALLALATVFEPTVAVFSALTLVTPLALGGGIFGARRLALGASALVPVAIVVLFFARHGATSGQPLVQVFRASWLEPLWDALEVLGPGNGAPGPARTLVRTLCFAAAFVQFATFRAVGDRRGAALAVATVTGLVLGYGGAFLPLRWPADPYFFLVPAWLAASLPAAWLLADLRLVALLRSGPSAFRLGFGLAALVFVPRVVRAIATYVPALLPDRVERASLDYRVSALVGLNEPLPAPLRHEPAPTSFDAVATFLDAPANARGRVVVDDPALAAFLATRTAVPVLGPLAGRGSASSDADPTSLLDGGDDATNQAAASEYLARYAAGWVVLVGPASVFDRVSDRVLESAFLLAGARVRRVRAEPNWFAVGSGRIAGTRMGSLRVIAEPSPRVTLRFHYDPRLACRPACGVSRAEIPGDRGGFASVERPPAEFELFLP